MPSDDGEVARPLTAEEIAEVRDRWTRAEFQSQLREGTYLACAAAADDILRLLVSLGISEAERDKARTTLDAWRPVVGVVARGADDLHARSGGWVCAWCEEYLKPIDAFHSDHGHAPDCPVSIARRLLGREA